MRNLIGLVVVLGILVVVGVIFRGKIMEFINSGKLPRSRRSATPSATATATKPVATATAKPTATVAAAPAASLYPKRDLIGAIGAEPMYDSPTAGKPLNFAHMVPGVQMIVALRPADLVKQPEFEHLADAKVLGSIGDLAYDDAADDLRRDERQDRTTADRRSRRRQRRCRALCVRRSS